MSEQKERIFFRKTRGWLNCPTACTAAERAGCPGSPGTLRRAGIDPEDVKARLYRRFDALAKEYAAAGRPVPALLKQALSDLRPAYWFPKGKNTSSPSRAAIRSVIDHAQRMQERLARLPRVTLATAYRNKKELSERDKNSWTTSPRIF